MDTYFEHETAQALYAAGRLATTWRQYNALAGSACPPKRAALLTARLGAAGFELRFLPDDRIVVGPGTVDVDRAWRHISHGLRDVTLNIHRRSEEAAAARRREIAAAAVRIAEAAEDEELEHVTL